MPVAGRALLRELGDELRRLGARVAMFDAQLAGVARQTPACRRLTEIPGIGMLTATALVAAVGDAEVMVDRLDRHAEPVAAQGRQDHQTVGGERVRTSIRAGAFEYAQRRGRIHACKQSPPSFRPYLRKRRRTIHAP